MKTQELKILENLFNKKKSNQAKITKIDINNLFVHITIETKVKWCSPLSLVETDNLGEYFYFHNNDNKKTEICLFIPYEFINQYNLDTWEFARIDKYCVEFLFLRRRKKQ